MAPFENFSLKDYMPQNQFLGDQSESSLLNDFLAHLRRIRYSESTISQHTKYIRSFLSYLKRRKKTERQITIDLVNDFMQSKDAPSPSSPEEYHPRRTCRAAIKNLWSFINGDLTKNPRFGSQIELLNTNYRNLYEQFIQYCIHEKEIASGQLKAVKGEIFRFLKFLMEQNIKTISKLNAKNIIDYFCQFKSLVPITIAGKAHQIRVFLRYLTAQSMIHGKLINVVPCIRYIKKARLPDVWPENVVERFLAAIDRTTTMGKRDYAIAIMITHLGMRVGDVAALCFDSLDWNNNTITIKQKKTGKPLVLPLLEEVGQALIAYLKERPQSEERVVFLSSIKPHAPFCCYGLPNKYLVKAGIVLPKECRRGFVSLRHTLATRLRKADVPFSLISMILGHSCPESTMIYAKVDIEMLRKAALNWKEVEDA